MLLMRREESFDLSAVAWAAGKGFQPDLQDPRFKSLFTSADYALDPTDPRFQQIDGSKTIAKEVATQRQQHAASEPVDARIVPSASNTGQEVQTKVGRKQDGVPGTDDSAQLKSMIASLKRKSSKASKTVTVARKVNDKQIKRKKQRVS